MMKESLPLKSRNGPDCWMSRCLSIDSVCRCFCTGGGEGGVVVTTWRIFCFCSLFQQLQKHSPLHRSASAEPWGICFLKRARAGGRRVTLRQSQRLFKLLATGATVGGKHTLAQLLMRRVTCIWATVARSQTQFERQLTHQNVFVVY
jgi:hypothetical protein